MSGFWSDEAYADTGGTEEDAAGEVLSSLENPDEQELEEEDEKLESDVEQRLEVASLYKLLLSGSFFDVESQASRIVTRRLRKFVTGELKALLGMAPSRGEADARSVLAPAQLEALQRLAEISPAQLEALRRIADKVLEREAAPALAPAHSVPQKAEPATLQKRPVPAEPAVMPRQKAAAPAEPAVMPRQKAAAPSLKTVAPVPQAKPPAAATKKPAKQQQKKAPVESIKAVNPEAPPGEKKVFRKETVKNGRKVQEYVDADGKRLAPTAVRDVTPQVRPPDAKPMPPPEQIGVVMEMQSNLTAEKAEEGLGAIMTRVQFG